MSIFKNVKHKKLKIIFGLFLLGVIYLIYKITSFLFGFGISFPPNKCDLLTGYELRGDLLFDKRSLCLFNLALEKRDPMICKYVKHNPTGCIREVALRRNDLSICYEINGDYDRQDCLHIFAEKYSGVDINKAMDICGEKNTSCQNRVIKEYQEANSIEGQKLVFRCLNYRQGDNITRLLCKLNTNYLVNWQGHHELFYMYGKSYPPMGNKLCEVVSSLTDNQGEINWCYQTVKSSTKEMSRVESAFYKFLQENPNGLGVPK